MDINLRCDQVELRETPSRVTYDCYYKDFAGFSGGYNFERDKWENVRDKYIDWVMEKTAQEIQDIAIREDLGYRDRVNAVNNIISELNKHILEVYYYDKLTFWIL